MRRETVGGALERHEPKSQRVRQHLGVEAPDLPLAHAELVGVQLQARQLARIEIAHAAGARAVAGVQVQAPHDRDDLRVGAQVDRHEQRARDRVAVELELPIVGAPPRADARAAELLAERRELGHVEIGARERAAPIATAARPP